MKELTRTYSDLLQDKRVSREQNKYEAFSRQRNVVLSKYRKVYQAYTDLQAGLQRAQQFYDEMKDTVDSMKKNVDSFVENRRSEGGQLLNTIEASKGSGADREQARLKELMERMSVSPGTQHSHSPVPTSAASDPRRPPPLQYINAQQQSGMAGGYNPARSPPVTPGYPPNGSMQPPPQPQHASYPSFQSQQQQNGFSSNPRRESYHQSYNPHTYSSGAAGPVSPPAHQQYFSPPPPQQYQQQQHPPSTITYGSQQSQQGGYGAGMPPGWQPPPPPPGPPPSQDYGALQASNYPSGPGGYASDLRRSAQGQGQQQQGGQGQDPWAGLGAWK